MRNFWAELTKPILALAPMEGYTDSAFRRMARAGGADVVYTEFISSDAIGRHARTALRKMQFDPAEQPVVCQIFGRDLTMFAEAARAIADAGFAGIDINFGCPARQVVGAGMGVALLRDPQYARQLIETILGTVDLPVSIKVRASIRREQKEIKPGADRATALALVEAIRDLPVAAIMVHGRSFEDGFKGDVDRDMIRAVKRRFSGIVLANGGLHTSTDVRTMLQSTSADGVGIARGALGRPWIFRHLRADLQGHPRADLTWDEIRDQILEHACCIGQAASEQSFREFRKHLSWYVRGIPGAAALRQQLVHIQSFRDVARILSSTSKQGADVQHPAGNTSPRLTTPANFYQ